jgi:hypothetical protein
VIQRPVVAPSTPVPTGKEKEELLKKEIKHKIPHDTPLGTIPSCLPSDLRIWRSLWFFL